jgi:hypothetical protein
VDVDGLSVFVDPVQARIRELEAGYTRRIHRLERDLLMCRTALKHSWITGQALNRETIVSDLMLWDSVESEVKGPVIN